MMWAVQATSPADVDAYREKYSDWFQTIDNQLKQLIPVIMHQLFVNDTAYTFQIKPVGLQNYSHVTVTDSFVKDNHTLQRMVFPDGGIHADDTAISEWMEPAVCLVSISAGGFHDFQPISMIQFFPRAGYLILCSEDGFTRQTHPYSGCNPIRFIPL
jgi:hypothetical protein